LGREGNKRLSLGLMARLGVPVGGRVRKLHAVEDQSAPIPEEITSELGGTIILAYLAVHPVDPPLLERGRENEQAWIDS
jgi:hypothetical protein